jgi:alginate O-acetyltransferase complex protein AlgI
MRWAAEGILRGAAHTGPLVLFNSYAFIFAFLPVVVAVYYWIGQRNDAVSAVWLAAASLFFYAWWSTAYVWLLLASITFNYGAGLSLARMSAVPVRRAILAGSVAANLALLGYFKYANFFLDSLERLGGPSHHMAAVILPVGISFFTFTQIAFLVDVWHRKASEYKFTHYALFVLYFPHLIAGPILHHAEMMPQFRSPASRGFATENLSVGLMVFAIGLFKKVVVADGVAPWVEPVFAAHAAPLTLLDSWCGVLAYAFQLYFDFSGYSDMAVGISRMLGIRLPINFYSPYKAASIIDFWRHWHMTLSRFLRDYLYVPLGGNRRGRARRYVNLMVTMTLGGLWHGASWTFVAWGALHGLYLVVNHGWRNVRRRLFGEREGKDTFIALAAGRLVTFAAVVVAWVFFRAATLDSAFAILKAMAGMNGTSLAAGALGTTYRDGELAWLMALLAFVWVLPNTYQIMERYPPALASAAQYAIAGRLRFMRWRPTWAWAAAFCALAIASVLGISRESVFLYYQF